MNPKKSNNISFVVDGLSKPTRLDIFLSQKLEDVSRSLAGKIISEGHCEVNSKVATKSSLLVQNQDQILVHIPEIKKIDLEAENIALDINYEDEDIIVINKAFGMVVHPSNGHFNGTLVNALLYHCKNLSMGFHEHRPGIVHRLDKDTGGLIVVAKTQRAHNHLAAQFKSKSAGRIYKAITFNKFKKASDFIESHLIRNPNNRLKYMSAPNSSEGRWAKTHYETLINGPISYVRLQLETGRTHQIRVHLSELGNPIVNDEIYSSEGFINNIQDARLKSVIRKNKNMFLFAEELHLVHPSTEQPMQFKAPLPKSFNDLLESLNEHIQKTGF